MKKSLIKLHTKYMRPEWLKEDMRLLQRLVTGRSVYKGERKAYKRYSKHRQFAFDD